MKPDPVIRREPDMTEQWKCDARDHRLREEGSGMSGERQHRKVQYARKQNDNAEQVKRVSCVGCEIPTNPE